MSIVAMSPERFDELRAMAEGGELRSGAYVSECLDEISRMADMVYVPGGWHCPKCKFHLTSSVISAKSGNVGASRQIPEPCPNDGMPMELDTWREDAMQMAEHIASAMCMDRINLLRANEGASVNVLCDNPEGPPNCAIEVCDDWTGWTPRRFEGDTLMYALGSAERAKSGRREP
jgi:hypothetical protein